MILLSGKTLGERQKQLNEKVIEASVDDFNNYKAEAAPYDVDKMFLIDLASKGKNIDFILETLKSGDNVQITRALNKSKWIGKDEYAIYINVDNLHLNIFSSMSMKMKKKVLIVLSTVVKSETRCITFYEYCIKEKLIEIAIKFLCHAPVQYITDTIRRNRSEAYEFFLSNLEVAVTFIGNSFFMAEIFMETMGNQGKRDQLLILLYKLYSISNEKYLDLLEKYKNIERRREIKIPKRFGRRISKDIIKKNKRRVLKNPYLYLNLLHKSIVSRNSTVSDINIYAVALLPDDVETFWNENFYEKYHFIIDIIPTNEKFTFVKKIFSDKYPGKDFEMNNEFYFNKFYNLMTNEEKDIWALNHIKSSTNNVGVGNNQIQEMYRNHCYRWYEFVKFDKAFEDIQKLVLITSDADKREDIVKVLISAAKSEEDLEILLTYFCDRHMNEEKRLKYSFIEKLYEKHNIFKFPEQCWMLFEKIIYSLDVFDHSNNDYRLDYFRAMFLIYYILREIPIPKEHNELLLKCLVKADIIKNCTYHLQPEQLKKVLEFLLKFYLSLIEAFPSKDYNSDDLKKISFDTWIETYLAILLYLSKTKDEIPDIIYKFMKMNWDSFKYHLILTSGKSKFQKFLLKSIVRLMKIDVTLLIKEFPLIKQYIQDYSCTTNWLIKKLKLYFQHDVAQKYLQFLTDCLASDDVHFDLIKVAVYGILILADQSFKIDFLQKYAPFHPRIYQNNIPQGHIHIQQAICAYAAVSRPPLPFSSIHQYITGDYVKSCLPIFNSYLMNLPLPAYISFVESLIDKPISIQKHGLPLAFKHYSTDNLKILLNDIWNRAKNISFRKFMYKTLFERVLKESDDNYGDEQSQKEYFEVLKKFTQQLHKDDDAEMFRLFVHGEYYDDDDDKSFENVSVEDVMPRSLRVQLLVAAWKTLINLPDRIVNFKTRIRIINAMKLHVCFVPEVEIETIIEDHISRMLDSGLLLSTNNEIEEVNLHQAIWDLTLAHLTNIYNKEQLKKRLVTVKHIMKKCLEMMNETQSEEFVKVYQFCRNFIKDLQSHSYDCHKRSSYTFVNIINSCIYHQLQSSQLKSHEIFSLSIQLRLSIKTRNIIIVATKKFSIHTDTDDKHYVLRRSLLKFSGCLYDLLIGYMAAGEYFPLFHKQIDGYILDEIQRIYDEILDDNCLHWSREDVIVAACLSLVCYDLHEIQMIVLRILPVKFDSCQAIQKHYQSVLDDLKKLDNKEVQYALHEKFVLGYPIE